MTYAPSPAGFGAFAGQSAGDAAKPGLLRRAFDAFMATRQRRADSELSQYFARHGRVLTDEIERDMMRRVISNSWGPRG